MISYAGVPLTEQTPPVAAWVERHWPAAEVYEFARLQWPGTLSAAAWSYTPTPLPPVRPGWLYWPRGAARWASAHYLVSEAQLAAIRDAGAGTAAKPLVIDDGTNSVTADLWMLPARPLMTAEDGLKLHLLTLVDVRFWWWQRAGNIAVDENTTTWADLYAAVGAALGESISVDPIPAAYLKPAADFASRYHHLPVLLDGVAWSVGQRIVRKMSGAVLAQGPTSALTSVSAQESGFTKIAGGVFDLIPG